MMLNNIMHNASCTMPQARGPKGSPLGHKIRSSKKLQTLSCSGMQTCSDEVQSLCDDFVIVCQLIQLMTNGTAKLYNASPRACWAQLPDSPDNSALFHIMVACDVAFIQV